MSCLSAKTHYPPPLHLWISSKVLILAVYLVHILLRLCLIQRKPEPTSKHFLTSRSTALCFFVASEFIVISPIKLFQKNISIIRRSLSAAGSSTLPPVQAWLRTVDTTIASASPVHLPKVWWSLIVGKLKSQFLFLSRVAQKCFLTHFTKYIFKFYRHVRCNGGFTQFYHVFVIFYSRSR